MIGYGLGVISKRLSRPEGLDGLFEHLEGNYELLSEDFSEFYPALQAFARASGNLESQYLSDELVYECHLVISLKRNRHELSRACL